MSEIKRDVLYLTTYCHSPKVYHRVCGRPCTMTAWVIK